MKIWKWISLRTVVAVPVVIGQQAQSANETFGVPSSGPVSVSSELSTSVPSIVPSENDVLQYRLRQSNEVYGRYGDVDSTLVWSEVVVSKRPTGFGEKSHISVDIEGQDVQFMPSDVQTDRYGLTHLTAISDVGKKAIFSQDAAGNIFATVILPEDTFRILSTPDNELVGVSPAKKVNLGGSSENEKVRLAQKRHAQVVELTLRNPSNFQLERRTADMATISGGDLGAIHDAGEVESYLRTLDPLLGSSANASFQVTRTKDLQGLTTYRVVQLLAGEIPNPTHEVSISVEKNTGRVQSITGTVFDLSSIKLPPRINTEEIAKSAALRVFQGKQEFQDAGPLEIVGSLKQVWLLTEDGPGVFWEGTLRALLPDPITYLFRIDANSGEVEHSRRARFVLRWGVCDADGDDIDSCTGLSGDYPYIHWEDNDNDYECLATPQSICDQEKFRDAEEVIHGNGSAVGLETWWEQELGNNCCDVSGGFIHVLVEAVDAGAGDGDCGTNPCYDPNTGNIKLPTVSSAKSRDVIVHEMTHALIHHDAPTVTNSTQAMAGAIEEGIGDAMAGLFKGNLTTVF